MADDEEPVLQIPWRAFEEILTALYDLVEVLQRSIEDVGEEMPPHLTLIKPPPKENGH